MAVPLWTAGVRRRVLPNGLTVIAQGVPGAPAVAVVTRVRAGFFDEPDRWSGISHVLEHMFFKGTPTRGVGEIARATKAAGGYLNAATSYDYTSYYTLLPARGLAAALEIQSDALRHALLDGDELRREIGVIIQEARRKLDTSSAVAQETLYALLFDRHRIRRWRIGAEEVLAALTREDLVDYYRSRYLPSRTIIAIAGGVDAEAALDLADRHYGTWPAGESDIPAGPAEPPRRERRAATLRGDVRQSELVLGWRGVPEGDPDELPLDLAATILSSGRASRLYRAMRQPGIVSSVSSYSYSPAEVGVFVVHADLEPDRVEEALAAAVAEGQDLGARGPGAEELDRARTLIRARWARRFESAEGRASALAAAEAQGDVTILDRDYARLLGISPEVIADAVSRHLDPGAASAVVYHPRDRGVDLTADRLAALFQVVPEGKGAPPPSVRIVAPPARAVKGTTTADTLHVVLAGADLLLRRRPGVPTATVGAYRLRRTAETSAVAGVGTLAVRSAIRGAGDYDSAALADAFERLGGAVAPSAHAEWWGFESSVLVEHLGEVAALLDLVLRAPHLSDEAIGVERALLADDAAQLADDMFRYPAQLAFRAAFGDTGYGLPAIGTPESVAGLAASDVRRWHAETLAAGRTTVVAVGDFELERAADQLAGAFGDLPSAVAIEIGGSPASGIGATPRAEVREREKAQSAFAMLFAGPTRRDPDRHAAEVWAAIAAGLGGRLFEALRDRRSLAYTVAAFPWQRRRAGALITYIAMAPEREEEARQAMLEELDRFGAAPPSEREVSQSVNFLTGIREVGRQSAAVLVWELLDAWLHGTGLEELADLSGPYRAVTPLAVQAVAERYLVPGRRVEGVVRGTGARRV